MSYFPPFQNTLRFSLLCKDLSHPETQGPHKNCLKTVTFLGFLRLIGNKTLKAMKKRAKTSKISQKEDSFAVKILCFIPFVILRILQLFYKWAVKIPDFSSPILGVIRLVFWGSLFLALTNDSVESWPYVALADQTTEFQNNNTFIFWLFQVFMVINLIVQLFVTCGFSYNATPAERAAQKTAFGMGALKSVPSSSGFGNTNVGEGFDFLNSLMGQESTRGKTKMLSKFFGGKFE